MIPLLLAGAGLGALLNKKDPLKGALLGAGLGAGGAALFPALGGMGAASAAGAAGTAGAAGAGAMGPFMPTAGAPLLDAAGVAIPSSGASTGGLLGGFAEQVKPFGEAAKAASSVGGLLGDQSQPMQGQAPPQTEGGGGLAQLYSSTQGDQAKNMELEMQQRMKQKELLKRFGGGYGVA